MTPRLELQNVQIAYGKHIVVNNCNLVLAHGEILSLLGASGCGKSTLLKAIAGLLPISAGQIRVRGKTVASDCMHLAPQMREIGMIFQDYALFPHLNAFENIAFGLSHLTRNERRRRARDMLAVVQLQELEKRYPHELSGGQQQRIAIARALAREPSILLLDEPFSNLDNAVREVLMDDMRQLFRDRQISAVFVTHSKAEAFALSDTVAIMQHGEIVQIDSPVRLYDHPANDDIAVFLGHGSIWYFERHDDHWKNSIGRIAMAQSGQVTICRENQHGADILLRPHQIAICADENGNGRIESVRFLGDFSLYHINVEGIEEHDLAIPSLQRFKQGTRVRLSLTI